MPLYDFRCKCGHEFEEMPPKHMGRVYPCPVCGKMTPADEIAECSFSLKGRGWASDGYSSR